jgi:Single-strand binding protein family
VKSQENKIEITGLLADEPKLRPTKAGRAVCDLRVLVHNGRYPSFPVRVGVFDAAAGYCVEHLSKGEDVRIFGELRFGRWRDRSRRWHEEFSIVGTVRPLAEALVADATQVAAVPARLPSRTERRRLLGARARLRASLPVTTYKLWIRPLRLGGIAADAVYLVSPAHNRAWAERRYSALIAGALRELGLPDHVSFAAVEIADHPEVAAGHAAGRLAGRAGATRRPTPQRGRGSESPSHTS